MSKWSEDQIIVIVALFFENKFSEGDKKTKLNYQIANYFNKSQDSIDMQWRNIKYFLAEDTSRKPSKELIKWIIIGINDYSRLKKYAKQSCKSNNWFFNNLTS